MGKISLYRREESNKWWMRYRDEMGKLRRQTTGTADETKARRIADKLEQQLEWEQALGTSPPADGSGDGDVDGAVGPAWDGFDDRIDRLERLMVELAQQQAEGQFTIASSISDALRELALRTRNLERILVRVSDSAGPPEQA